ncbi:MAG: GGDEF domain-containing protein [Eubacteriales bacterium]
MLLKTFSLKALKKFLTVPEEDKKDLSIFFNDFTISVNKINIKRSKLIIKTLILLNAVILTFTFLLKGKEFLLKPDIYYLILYFLLVTFLIPILFLFIELDKNSLKENTVVNIAQITFTGFILCLSMFVSLLDQFGSGHLYVYTAVILLTAVIIYFKPMILLIIYISNHLIFIILIPFFQSSAEKIFENIVYSTIILILSWVVCYMRYLKLTDDYIKTVKLQRQNDELARINRDLVRKSQTDCLTGAYNRHGFDIILNEEWNRCKKHFIPLTLMMVDIDSLKKINDNYGHQAGDHCIVQVSNILASCIGMNSMNTCQSSGTLARFGGDEFIILLTDIDKEHITEIAEQIRKEVEQQSINIIINSDSSSSLSLKHITVSLGICTVIPTDNSAIEKIIYSADTAMYAAKKHRNKIVVA